MHDVHILLQSALEFRKATKISFSIPFPFLLSSMTIHRRLLAKHTLYKSLLRHPRRYAHSLPSALSYATLHQSSSSSFFPCILACLALNASAKPPARLGVPLLVLSGVPLPLSPFVMLLMLTALSLGAGGGAGFFPMGLFAGGAGGVGLAFAAAAGLDAIPLAAGRGGGGTRAATGGGAGGAWGSSLR